jgi:hypothetical protein
MPTYRLLLEIELRASFAVNSCSPFVAARMTLFVHYDPSSFAPTTTPSPTYLPSSVPTTLPTTVPTHDPTFSPTHSPTYIPTLPPSISPTSSTYQPSQSPTSVPSYVPVSSPTISPTLVLPFDCSGRCGCTGCSSIGSIIVGVILCGIGFAMFVGYYFVIKSNERTRQRDSIRGREPPTNDDDRGNGLRRYVGMLIGDVGEFEFRTEIPVVEFRRTRRYRAAAIAARVLKKQIKNAPAAADRAENGSHARLDNVVNTPKNMTAIDVNVGGVSVGGAVMETVENSDWIEIDDDDKQITSDTAPQMNAQGGSLTTSSIVISSHSQNMSSDNKKHDGHNIEKNLCVNEEARLAGGDIVLDRLCSICLADIEDRDLAKELNCFHHYHADWLVSSTISLSLSLSSIRTHIYFYASF